MALAVPAAKAQIKTTEPVLVFGTDLAGRHENDTAATAVRLYRAEADKGSGPTGHAWAIPYRNSAQELLSLEIIANYVGAFCRQAQGKPDIGFVIARFGCESGAYSDQHMARLFAKAPPNCVLPGLWRRALDARQPARLIVFDPAGLLKDPRWQDRLGRHLALNAPLWNAPAVELVSIGAARSIVANDLAAKRLGLKHRIFTPNAEFFGQNAQVAAEHRAAHYATHLLCISDFEQTAQPHQIRIIGAATRAGLHIDQLDASLME